MSRSFIDCKLFSILTSALRGPSAIAELPVEINPTSTITTFSPRGLITFTINFLEPPGACVLFYIQFGVDVRSTYAEHTRQLHVTVTTMHISSRDHYFLKSRDGVEGAREGGEAVLRRSDFTLFRLQALTTPASLIHFRLTSCILLGPMFVKWAGAWNLSVIQRSA